MKSIKPALNDYLTRVHPALTDFCVRLVQTPSVNGVHNELDVARQVAAQAQQLGLHAELVAEHPKRPNVIVSTAPDGPAGLLLVAHLDTVPPGDASAWTYPPFSGHTVEGKLFGRGASDNKGGLAAALYALAALTHVAGPQARRAQLVCVPNEESGATGDLGVRFLRRTNRLSGLGAIYTYAGDEIPLGHRGLARYRLVAIGQAAHTGMAGWQNRTDGLNAVTALADLLLVLEQVDTPSSQRKYFDRFRAVITPGTVIQGGVAVNIVPDRAEALVDVRTIPEFDRPQVEDALDRAIQTVMARRPGLQLEYHLLNYLPSAISDEHAPLFSLVERAARLVRGETPPRVVAGPANEGYLFIEHGIPIVCGFGPRGANAHAVNEYVEIDSLVEAALIYSLVGWEMGRLEIGDGSSRSGAEWD